jgi:hypothetical protein
MFAYFDAFNKLVDEHLTDLPTHHARGAERMEGKHLHVLKFTSRHTDKLYVCVRVEPDVAELLADLSAYPVQLSKSGVGDLNIKLSDEASTPAYVEYHRCFRNLCKTRPDPFEDGAKTVLRPIDPIRLFL